MSNKKIAIIGGGNMGFALASSYLASQPNASISVSDPIQAQRDRFKALPINTTTDNREAVENSDLVILAVKPQDMQSVVSELKTNLQRQLVISIAAGISLRNLNTWLGNQPIIRCMPNTPALVGDGMFGLLANEHVTKDHKEFVESVFGSAGKTVWFNSDREIDAVTAVSGSGPAYFFYLTEAIVEAGLELGLSATQAHELAVQTSIGAGRMLREGQDDPAQLRKNVTSPGGTTEAALQVMNQHEVADSIKKAIRAAFNRAQELDS